MERVCDLFNGRWCGRAAAGRGGWQVHPAEPCTEVLASLALARMSQACEEFHVKCEIDAPGVHGRHLPQVILSDNATVVEHMVCLPKGKSKWSVACALGPPQERLEQRQQSSAIEAGREVFVSANTGRGALEKRAASVASGRHSTCSPNVGEALNFWPTWQDRSRGAQMTT
jgi:hypothetical protein